MAEMTAEMDQIQVPDGGVASFMMSDEDIANLEREEDQQLAEEVYGGEGISQFTDVAAQMASLGRFGDDVIVHAQTGELVIPKRILDDNPEIKQMVFEQLMAQGIEDPEQYVVGSGSASINPETGLAEYFFKGIRRAISKVAKGVKKVASKVVKVAKKVAPIVLPIALAMTPLGPIYGAALGSGIGTLMQGGSFKDALKSAAISGLSGAAFQGFKGPGTFTENIGVALEAPGARFSQTLAGATGPDKFFRPYVGDPVSPAGQTPTGSSTGPSTSPSGASEYSLAGQANRQSVTPEGVFEQDISRTAPSSSGTADLRGPQGGIFEETVSDAVQKPTSFMDTAKDYYQKGKDFLFPSGPSGADLAAEQAKFSESYAKGLMEANPGLSAAEAKTAADAVARQQITMESIQPGIISKYGPLAATGLGAMYLSGGFDTPEPTPEEDSPLGVKRGPTGVDLFQADPTKYTVDVGTAAPVTYRAPETQYRSYLNTLSPQLTYNPVLPSSRPTEGSPFYRDTRRDLNLLGESVGYELREPPFYRDTRRDLNLLGESVGYQLRAKGGEIFPRRTGGIMPDEGVPGKDSVRAMLMPGEFVMTTDAVKGMGNGNLRQGIKNMYGVMANLERKGRMA